MTNESTVQVTPSAEQDQASLPHGGLARSETSTSTLLTREQQLKEEIDKLKREEEALKQKDEQIKKNIDVLREQKEATLGAKED
ncbi:hypothetical protein VKS41_007871 [Umbelopsis sp. WA50703]|jgi:F0F1-type ATP synthase epsilon subunit